MREAGVSGDGGPGRIDRGCVMGAGAAIGWAFLLLAGLVGLGFAAGWVVTLVRDRIQARRSWAGVVDEQIAAAEQTYQTELRAAPVIGVPYVAVTDDGSHDLYPHMSEHCRDAVVAELDGWFALPAAERAR